MRVKDRKQRRVKTKRRYRTAVHGTADRPRLSVYRSLRHVYAQIIDDDKGETLASVSTSKRRLPGASVQPVILRPAKERGVESVVFDRGGFRYHGVIQAFADGAREAGLKF